MSYFNTFNSTENQYCKGLIFTKVMIETLKLEILKAN
jgi:hypothetical protein